MIRKAQSEAKLCALLAGGSLQASDCGQAFLKLVAPLLAGNVLAWQRSGAGRRLVANDADALKQFCQQQFPNADLPVNAGGRVSGVGRFRNTKATANDENEIVSLRVWRDEALCENGKPVGAAIATVTNGVFSFLLSKRHSYELRGHCALVENPAVFTAFEELDLDVGATVYGHGRISGRLIDWLARTTDSGFQLIHLPDYDPVGLSEYQRLQSRLGSRVQLHLPTDLETRFARFSNRELLEKGNSQSVLAQLRRSALPAIQRVVQLIDRHNAGLEQEALLLQI